MFTRPISLFSHALSAFMVLLASQFGSAASYDIANHQSLMETEAPTITVQEIQPLKPGEWVEREIDPKSTHLYAIDLQKDDAIDVEFGRNEVALRASIWGPDNAKFAAPVSEHPAAATDVYYATVASAGSRERLIAVAKKTGIYHLRIQGEGTGTYKLRYARRDATNNDRKYAEAARLMFEVRTAGLGLRSLESIRGHHDEQIAIYRELGDMASVGLALRYRGTLEASLGEFAKSIATAIQAREHFIKIGLIRDAIFASPCRSFEALGDFQSTISCFGTELELSRLIADKQAEAGANNNLGVTYHRMADEEKARYFYNEALGVIRSLSPRTEPSWQTEMLLYTNFGNLARGMNGGEVPIEFFPSRSKEDFEKALPFLFQAVEICERNRFGFIQFNYRQIGNTYAELGRFEEAIDYLQRSIKRNIDEKQPQVAAIAKKELARVFIRQGRKEEGTKLLEEVLPALRSRVGEVHDIALWLNKADKPDRARELLGESLAIARRQHLLPMQARILYGLATVERDVGNLDNSRRHIGQAIEIADSLRNRITNDEIRSVYFAAVKKYYDFYIDLLMQAHRAQPEKQYDRVALEVSEKARSRNLIDLLKLSGVDIRQGVELQLLEQEKTLKIRLAERASRQGRLMMSRHTPEETEKAQREVNEAAESLARVESEIRQKSPRYAAVTQPSAMTVGQTQQLLDSGTVLLEYSLGEHKSYVWAVSHDTVQGFELPAGGEIDKQVRAVYGAITQRNLQNTGETGAQRSLRVKAAEEEYAAAAAILSETLLAPVSKHIKNKRIVIVPDGSLNYVSIGALPFPRVTGVGGGNTALIQTNEIVTLPSAGTLARLREDRGHRAPRTKRLAVFADPVFSDKDARTRSKAMRSEEGPVAVNAKTGLRDLDLAAQGAGLSTEGGLPRLPFSRREADAIAGALPSNVAIKRVDFQASKDAVFTSGLEQYRMVHFATHGLLDSRHPALSGLVLSLVDKQGSDVDGFLRLQDIYNLKLNADLVVLSACNTALGKEVRGEGLIGLTRGFMYAGAPRVVASLWKVDDAATAALMTIFYRKMLVENMRPAAALRAAQNEMMKQPRWRSPYYWAPFVLQGEWK